MVVLEIALQKGNGWPPELAAPRTGVTLEPPNIAHARAAPEHKANREILLEAVEQSVDQEAAIEVMLGAA